MLKRILRTDDDTAALVLRIVLALVVLGHGTQKAFGWFGGYGIDGTLGYFASLGVPTVVGALIILAETAGMVALLAGFLTRLHAVAVLGIMAGAILFEHGKNGFFMNWGGQLGGEGYEFHLLAMAMAFALLLLGGGRLSVDRALSRTR